MQIKKTITVATSLAVLVGLTYVGFGVANQSQTAQAKDAWSAKSKVDLTDKKAKLGYTVGTQIAANIKESGMLSEIDLDALIAAQKDIVNGVAPRLTVEQMQQVQTDYAQEKQKEFMAEAEKNKKETEDFLAKNKAKDGVKTTESGLQYEILREGKGKKPTDKNTVKIHYAGKKIDQTVFDSSYERKEPTEFPVGSVIPGFSEGLQLMNEGAKYRFTIPSDLAYGVQAPPAIGPNQALIFEVELIEVK